MQVIAFYVEDEEQRRRRRRGKWLIPLIVGCTAALAIGREKPAPAPVPAPPPPKKVVAPTQVVVPPPQVEVNTPPVVTETVAPPLPVPSRLAVAPARLDFGDGPLTRGVPAQMAVIRNDGGEPLARVSARVDGPFLLTSGCADALAPGDQCMIAVVFAPQQPGTFNGSLKIAAGVQRAKIALRGSVPRPPVVLPPPPPPRDPDPVPPLREPVRPQPPPQRTLCSQPKFMNFTSTGKRTVTLTNPEATPIRVVAILPIGQQGQTISGYEIESRKCLRELKPGQQCTFTIRANQIALQRAERMELTVFYDEPVTGGRRAAKTIDTCGSRR